ncbi:MAG TPA: sensor histidine kinase [Sediminispirochaeta sp.]|nr:sensor histidine kinase [Sediminispirochaeta sp.]
MKQVPDSGEIELSVHDSGSKIKKIPEESAEGLGLVMVRQLVTQIDGRIYFDASDGLRITILFPQGDHDTARNKR